MSESRDEHRWAAGCSALSVAHPGRAQFDGHKIWVDEDTAISPGRHDPFHEMLSGNVFNQALGWVVFNEKFHKTQCSESFADCICLAWRLPNESSG